MKKIFCFCLSSLLFLTMACEKPIVEPVADPYHTSPSSALPADFKGGVWFWGYAGPFSYYDPNGNDVGREIEAGRQYKFLEEKGQGRLQFQQYLGMLNSSGCTTEVYTHRSGTIKFEKPGTFTFYPVEGTVKIVKGGKYSSCAKETSEQKLTADQLTPTTVLYEIRVVDGRKLLYVFNEEDTGRTNPVFVYSQVTL